ncbi:PspA/IM30 family protein [Terracidiphilus sp.]|jgi:phage shock protein A|uniref:PspA/IM30 family protein n=1 Tax=Terracidiphilus sp. TaxID=1964191 RepID=UPI003C2744CF
MSLLERVGTLLRANLNELVEKAEDPEKLLKQIVLDMENQLMQLKTQVAIAIADQHLLEKKRGEQERETADWRRKAELAVGKGQDDMARAALERSLSHEALEKGFASQVVDQRQEAEHLRQALGKLEQKLSETRARAEMLVAEHRRARAVGRAAEARRVAGIDKAHAVERMQSKVHARSAESEAASEVLAQESLEERFRTLESEDRVELLLQEIKSRMEERQAAVG